MPCVALRFERRGRQDVAVKLLKTAGINGPLTARQRGGRDVLYTAARKPASGGARHGTGFATVDSFQAGVGVSLDRRSLTGCLAWLFGAVLSSTGAAASTDSGSSLNLLLKADLSDDWFLISRSNLASRNNHEDFFFGYTGAALGYQFTRRWSVRAGFRHAWIRVGDEWLEEDRPFVETYFADTVEGFRVSNRARIEFRFFDYREDDVRLRNELTIEAPWSLTQLGLRPYLEEELFYSTDAGHVEANWLGGGLAWQPAKGVKLKAGYRWNHFRIGDEWRDRDVVVAGLNLFF